MELKSREALQLKYDIFKNIKAMIYIKSSTNYNKIHQTGIQKSQNSSAGCNTCNVPERYVHLWSDIDNRKKNLSLTHSLKPKTLKP